MKPRVDDQSSADLVVGSSRAARDIRAHHWQATPIGPIEGWPDTLRMFVNLILGSPSPMQVLWGDDLLVFYNDAMEPFLAGKTPAALGCQCREVWREAWPAVGGQLESVLRTGESVSFKSVFLPLEQNGVLQDMYWDYSYIAIRTPEGRIAGILNISQNVTAAVLAQKELRASEAQARRVLSSIGDAVIVTDSAGHVLQMNPVAEALTGWKNAEAAGTPLRQIFRIVNETTREEVESPADRVLRSGNVVGLANHTVLISKDGRESCIDDSGAPIRNDAGELTGVVLVFRNIDERRRAEKERATLDERLTMALSAANGVGIWDWNIVTDRVYTDATFARLYGVDPDEATRGITIAAFTANIHPDDVSRVGDEIQEAIRTRGDFVSEYRLVQSDESVRWVFAKGRCSYAADGRPLRFPGVTLDITERKAMESALRSGEESFRTAVETAQLGSWDLDLRTGEFQCSDLCRRNYGRAPGVAFGYPDQLASIHPEDRAKQAAAMRDAIANHTTYRCEYRILWPDESMHWIIASGRVTYDDQGTALRIHGVSMDVTERHQTYAALMQTEKLAAVGRLAASIAHEINNPLESVTNLLYLARTSDNLAEIQDHLDVAERELRRVSVITNQTLRFHRQSTKPKPVTFSDLFETVLSIYQGRLLNSNVRVEKRPRSERAVLCFDGEIRQVLNNLVGNAIDAMQGKGGRLLLRSREATRWPEGRKGLVLTIADTGSGISHAAIKKIFEPFYTTKGIGGTGLGLWVSAEIVQRHEGSLRVRSRQRAGRSGTVFTLFLPFDAVAR